MATFVLVHGSNGGGWIWQKVAPLLRAAGHEVYTPTLTGLSDRSHLLECGVNLTTHITDIVNLIIYEDISNVILVGNSYAGMVITGVAAAVPERLRLLVYLDAYLPDDRQSEVDLWPPERRAIAQAAEAQTKGLAQPPEPAMFGITAPEMVEWLKARSTPQPVATYTEPVPPGNARSAALPRVFIHCTGNPPTTPNVFGPFAEKARSKGWEVRELAAGHLAMLSAPAELADLLLDIAIPHSDRGNQADPKSVVERWIRAMDRHDLETAVACFARDYTDEAPARRGESVHGQEKVRENFEALFKDIPNLRAELLGTVAGADTVWMEWHIHGTRTDGVPFEFAGVNIFGVQDDQFVWGHIYTELVRDAGGIDAQIQRMTGSSIE